MSTDSQPSAVVFCTLKQPFGGVGDEMFTGACNPPPVQAVSLLAVSTRQVRVRSSPQAAADLAKSNHEEIARIAGSVIWVSEEYCAHSSLSFSIAGTSLSTGALPVRSR